MFSLDFDRLLKSYGCSGRPSSDWLIPDHLSREDVRINEGSRAGATARLVGFADNKLLVEYPDGTAGRPAYTMVDLFDHHGEVNTTGPRDVIGEPTPANALIAYSVKAGRRGHDFCVGRVYDFSKSGVLSVRRILADGEVVLTRVIDKVHKGKFVKLPVDQTRLTMAVFTDFRSIDGSLD